MLIVLRKMILVFYRLNLVKEKITKERHITIITKDINSSEMYMNASRNAENQVWSSNNFNLDVSNFDEQSTNKSTNDSAIRNYTFLMLLEHNYNIYSCGLP